MRVLSVLQEHCGTHNNLMKIFSKNYTLYGVYIFLNFGIRLNHLPFTTRKHNCMYQKLFKDKTYNFLGSNFINLWENLIKSEVCC